MFRIIYLRGDVFRIIHRKLKFGGDIWGGCVPYYIPEGGCVPYFFPDRRFYSGQPILHFVIVTYEFIYLINWLDKNDVYRIYLIYLISRHDFSKFSSSHEIMVEGEAAGRLNVQWKFFHAEWEKSVLKSVSNRTNCWYSRKSLDAYLYSVSIFLSFNWIHFLHAQP